MIESAVRERASAWLSEGRSAVVVEVLRTQGSAPRRSGTRMLVAADETRGTIGGGHIELKAIAAARTLLAAHLLHDAGSSLNPAIDLGQVEGGFIQGMGWLTMEELVWHPDDGSARAGMLLTHAPSTYKIPTANDCPSVFDVRLWQRGNVADTIHRSKATGEPPLLLPFSVFFAIRDAISAVGDHKVNPPLRAPATSEAILDAVSFVEQAVQEHKAA